MSNETSIDLKQCVLDAVLSGLIALVVFGPIVGVVLDGYGFDLHYERVGWIIAIVMAGRFLLSSTCRPAAGGPCWSASRGLAAASTSCRRATRPACAGSCR